MENDIRRKSFREGNYLFAEKKKSGEGKEGKCLEKENFCLWKSRTTKKEKENRFGEGKFYFV